MADAAGRPNQRGCAPKDLLEPISRKTESQIGTESMIVFKDALQVSDAEARKVRRWAICALFDAARK